jgi:hypothetical protein
VEVRVGDRVTDPGPPGVVTGRKESGLSSKVKRLSALIGALLVALSMTLTGCSGAATNEQKEEKKKEASEKEKESKEKKEGTK